MTLIDENTLYSNLYVSIAFSQLNWAVLTQFPLLLNVKPGSEPILVT